MRAFFDNIAHLLLVMVLSLLGLLPLAWAQALGAFLGECAYRVGRKRVHAARCNIAVCYPDMPAAEREAMVKASFREAGKWFTEFGVAWLWSSERVNALISVRNQHLFDEALAEGRGVVLIVPHLGNWEVMNTWLAARVPLAALYKPIRSSWFECFVKWRRSRQNAVMAPASSQGVRQVMKRLKEGSVTAVLADHLPSNKAGVFAPFFGRMALTGKLTASLARVNHSVVLSAVLLRKPNGQGFELVFQSVEGAASSDDQQAARALNQAVEQCIQLAPEQHQWMYKRFARRLPSTPDAYTKVP
ncbi:MAG TPA: lysophospholipid acyltransferase family protein [Pseudomonadales bacterium]